MKIGIQASSLKKFLQTPQDVRETFHRLKEIGYNFVQIEWVGENVPAESVRESLDDSGLVCVGTQDGFDEIDGRLDEYIARGRLWGGKYMCAIFENSNMAQYLRRNNIRVNHKEPSRNAGYKNFILDIVIPCILMFATDRCKY